MITIPSDSISKFFAFAGLAVISASFTFWLTSSDKTIAALASANAALAESTELSRQYTVLGANIVDQAKSVAMKLAEAKALKAAGKSEQATDAFNMTFAQNDQIGEQIRHSDELKAQIDKKSVEAAGLAAAATAHRQSETTRLAVSVVGFFGGMTMFVLGCIAWARSTRSCAETGEQTTSANR